MQCLLPGFLFRLLYHPLLGGSPGLALSFEEGLAEGLCMLCLGENCRFKAVRIGFFPPPMQLLFFLVL